VAIDIEGFGENKEWSTNISLSQQLPNVMVSCVMIALNAMNVYAFPIICVLNARGLWMIQCKTSVKIVIWIGVEMRCLGMPKSSKLMHWLVLTAHYP
jgi:hypothetical protein